MWFSKTSIHDVHVVGMAMGKSPAKYGEYGQCYPFLATHRVSTVGTASQYYGPTVLQVENEFWMWCTGQFGATPKIVFSKAYKDFEGDCWDDPTTCEGVDGCYYPTILYEDDTYHMWCCKLSSGLSKVFYYTSSDGLTWEAENASDPVYSMTYDVNAPCVIKRGDDYVMFFTEHTATSTKISSVTSSDGITWSSYQVEIDEEGVYNPCVVVDRYKGNEIERLYYNKTDSGEVTLRTARLEDRVWTSGSSISGDLFSVIPTVPGASKTVYIPLSANGLSGLTTESDVEIQLVFNPVTSTKDFFIQSEWTRGDDQEFAEYVEPELFVYHEIIKSLNYMGMT
jgi:hypothetical protein